ncbi:hypothetical protein Leryth_004345 [Lithospermum erythrorhizon]|nr:hypothetical protein Leryth_004345 [Lithospermum erythrorhizon]
MHASNQRFQKKCIVGLYSTSKGFLRHVIQLDVGSHFRNLLVFRCFGCLGNTINIEVQCYFPNKPFNHLNCTKKHL